MLKNKKNKSKRYRHKKYEKKKNIIIFFLERFFKDANNIDSVTLDEGKEYIIESFKENIVKEYSWNMYMDEVEPIKYYNFDNLNDLIQFLEDVLE